MEKIFCNNRVIIIAFFTVFSTAFAPVARANDTPHKIPVELKFIRWIKDQPLFELSFVGSEEQNDFTIIIRDEFSNILYKENIKGEKFSKSFLLNTDEVGDDTFQFEIISKKINKSTVFEISRNTFLEEKMELSTSK